MVILNLLRALPVLIVLAACNGKVDPNRSLDASLVRASVAGDEARDLDLRFSRTRAVLFVDATCQNSLYALEQALADSAVRTQVSLRYYPQVPRDPVARFETAALECARRMGSMKAYTSQRLDDAARGTRPAVASALSIGLDTASFMRCVADPNVNALIKQHEDFAKSVGVWSLPALVLSNAVVIGRDPVVRSLGHLGERPALQSHRERSREWVTGGIHGTSERYNQEVSR